MSTATLAHERCHPTPDPRPEPVRSRCEVA